MVPEPAEKTPPPTLNGGSGWEMVPGLDPPPFCEKLYYSPFPDFWDHKIRWREGSRSVVPELQGLCVGGDRLHELLHPVVAETTGRSLGRGRRHPGGGGWLG